MVAQAATGEHKEKPGFGEKGGAGGDRGGAGGSIRKSQVRIRISQDRIRRATHSIRKNTMPIYGEISSIRGEPMSIRNQPCPRRDGGMEVDGDMEVGSIKIKTLSIKINTQPFFGYHTSDFCSAQLRLYMTTICRKAALVCGESRKTGPKAVSALFEAKNRPKHPFQAHSIFAIPLQNLGFRSERKLLKI